MHVLLSVEQVVHSYGNNFSLQQISFQQLQGQHMAIVGQSGSGKTTLLKIIGGLLDAASGKVIFKGKKVTGPLYNLIPGHNGIGFLSQHYELRNNYYVGDYLDYGNQLTAYETKSIFEACEIAHLLARKTNSGLSGGEKQRIALAKVLLTKPELLLLDEPFSNLDYHHKTTLQNVLQQLEESFGITYLMVSHDPRDLLPWAENILVLQNGSQVQRDTPTNVYYHPENEYVAALFGPFNKLGTNQANRLNFATENQVVFLRPNQLKMFANHSNEGESFVVTGIDFFGAIYLYTLNGDDLKLVVSSTVASFAVGDSVGVAYHWPD